MLTAEPSFEIAELNPDKIMRSLERAGRTCYKSEDKMTEGSAETLLAKLIASGHHSVLEHEDIQVRFICDRGVSHELVRHRIASFSQESTRYCNYGNEKFGGITVIRPFFLKTYSPQYKRWIGAMADAESWYLSLLDGGCMPQEARSVLPNSTKTEIVMTANIREWRNVFSQRCSKAAHPQMRQIMIPLLIESKSRLPVLFGDIEYDESFETVNYARCKA